jgi:hypothetical protein
MKLLKIYEGILKEFLQKEAHFTQHIFDRLEDRLDQFYDEEISSDKRREITRLLNNLRLMDFHPNHSFALKVADLEINRDSELYVNVRGREYYRVDDFMGRDSTGNQIWMIIRDNRATTIMLRKDIQPSHKLNVDYIINDKGELPNYIKKGLIKI